MQTRPETTASTKLLPPLICVKANKGLPLHQLSLTFKVFAGPLGGKRIASLSQVKSLQLIKGLMIKVDHGCFGNFGDLKKVEDSTLIH